MSQNRDESKGHPTRSPEGEPLKNQTWNTQNAKSRPRPGQSVQSDRKHARRMSGGAPPSPNQVLKNQRDTSGRATTGQDPRNPRNYASSVRAQENGRTWHFRTRTLRTENHPEKVETDKHRPGAREVGNHVKRKGRCQEQRSYRYARNQNARPHPRETS